MTRGPKSYYGGHTREYAAWRNMLQRCYNQRDPSYPYYGGKGITVCQSWCNSYALFVRDVGLRPSPKHSLDRFPNNTGNYEPGNVRWATYEEQRANCRDLPPGTNAKRQYLRKKFKGDPIVKVSIGVPKSLDVILDRMAREKAGRCKGELVRQAIEQYLSANGYLSEQSFIASEVGTGIEATA